MCNTVNTLKFKAQTVAALKLIDYISLHSDRQVIFTPESMSSFGTDEASPYGDNLRDISHENCLSNQPTYILKF